MPPRQRLVGWGRRLRRDTVARDTVWASGLEGLQLAVMLLSFALLGKQLGPADFGAYAAMYAIIGILGGLVYGGATLTVVQHLVRQGEDLSAVLRAGLGLVLTLGTLGAVLGTIIGQYTVPSVSVWAIATFMVAELVGTACIEILAISVYARDGVAIAARYRVLPVLAKLCVLLALFALDRLTIPALGLMYVLIYPVMACGIAGAVGRRYGITIRPGRPVGAQARTSGLYSTTISAMTLQGDGDKVVLTAAGVGADAGLYAAAYRLVLMGMVPFRALLAASHRRFLEHDPDARNQHVRRSAFFSGIGIAYGLVFAVALYFAAPLVTVLLGSDYEGTATMMRVLAPLVALHSWADFGLNGLLGLGRVGVRTAVTVLAAGTALLLYVLLIPRIGWEGAVIGTYVSEVLLGVVGWSALFYFQRRHNAALTTRSDRRGVLTTLS